MKRLLLAILLFALLGLGAGCSSDGGGGDGGADAADGFDGVDGEDGTEVTVLSTELGPQPNDVELYVCP